MNEIQQVPAARTGDDEIPKPTRCGCLHTRYQHPRVGQCKAFGCLRPRFWEKGTK